jgi:exonuclease SbcC
LGSVNQELSNIRSLKEDEKKADEEIRVIQKELDIYSLVERASSKKSGVPTYIMENSIPEIESTANLLLERIVGGRFSIRIDTQLGTKTTDTMREVFKVSIFDCGKARPYQTFSGGERFVVDFALRVAISKFLACRAGTEVRLLVIDEGLSALDDINRQMVLDAIFEIAKDFRKVFVVTHITELQDEFGEKLYFTKDEEGSHVKVVA